MASITERITDLVRDAVAAQGVDLWDVRFVKEGASHYLRIFIDREDGISIDDCTNVSHAVDPILDEADPIDCSYYLEVCSPGLDRELSCPRHYEWALGRQVRLRLFRPVDGSKEYTGILRGWADAFVLDRDGNELRLEPSAVSKVNLVDEEFGAGEPG